MFYEKDFTVALRIAFVLTVLYGIQNDGEVVNTNK